MKASLFITCLADVFFPAVGRSVVDVLEAHGVDVDFPAAQTCCGQPAYNSGYHKDARKAAKQMIQAFADSERVVTPSGSCASMIRHYYPSLFADEPDWQARAEALADKTYEFSEFLVRVLGVTEVAATYAPDTVATYHSSCHMARGLGIKDDPQQLLQGVGGLELKDLPHCQDCCGFGGTFAAKMSDISREMIDEKIKHVESTGASLLIGSDMGCLMNIGGRLQREGKHIAVRHVAEVLAEGRKRG
ncbi:MAG TPA: (Fe-S)-binding protein [Bacilli bacterium]|nr:(Fe-S)-binding protein [Bacilli bacterium]